MAKKIGYIDMVGDLFHIGHMELIERVHDLGYSVCVGVHADNDVERYKRRPILTLEERVATIRMCKHVDRVIEGAPVLIDEPFMLAHGIDMVFHGHEEHETLYEEMYSVPIKLGKFTRTQRKAGISTTAILDRVALSTKDLRTTRTDTLKHMLRTQKRTLRIMETHSGISGIIAERSRDGNDTFDGMWSSSLTASITKGRPDIEVVDTTARLQIVRDTMNSTSYLPLIYDADTGGPNKEIFAFTVRDLEDLGVSACIIEDKTGLKQNSLFGTSRVQVLEDIDTFCEKIKAGTASRRNDNFMIIARIEALIAGHGQEEALKRAKAYIEAGADAIMIHSKETSFDEVKNFMTAYNAFESRVPVVAVPSTYDTVTEDVLWENGIHICIYANHVFRASFKAMETVAKNILGNKCGYRCRPHMTSIKKALVLLDTDTAVTYSSLVEAAGPKPSIFEVVDCVKSNFEFIVGVPDSTLRSLSDCIANDRSIRSMVTVNEGAAISLASGWAMATNKVPLVYMQNSGLGNAVNPLTSLTHQDVYSIPMVLLIGWRGAPGAKDEPQHLTMGNCTQDMLDLMSIPTLVASSENIMSVLEKAQRSAAKESKPVAVLIKRGVLPSYDAVEDKPEQAAGLTRSDALSSVLDAVGVDDVIVCTTGFSSRDLWRIRKDRRERADKDFLCVGSMGYALSIAQGIAIAQPHRIVWCIDGDGAQLMHLGTLTGALDFCVPNLKHVTLNNRMHESVGITPTAAETVDLRRIAFAAGYSFAKRAAANEDLKNYLRQARNLTEAAYIEVITRSGCGNDKLPRPSESPLERKNAFVDALQMLCVPDNDTPKIACSNTGDPILLTPGPLTTSLRVKEAMMRDVGSREASFETVLNRVLQRTLDLVGVDGSTHACVPLPGSGTYAVESMLSLAQSPILLCVNGAYGRRMVEICQAQGIAHEVCEIDQLTAFTSDVIITALSTRPHIGCIALVHCETTSGLLNPLDDIVEKVREKFPQCKIFVDAMSSIGAVRLDVTNIQAVAFSSNKGIEGPPGLALVVLSRLLVQQSDKAQHTLSLNLRRHWKHLSGTGQCQFTPPTHVVLGLDEALRHMLDDEGAINRFARYARNRDILCAGMAKIGFKSIVSSDMQAPVIVTFPLNGISYQAMASKMCEYGYVIYEGKIPNTFRVGCMGISNTQMEGFMKTFTWASQVSWL